MLKNCSLMVLLVASSVALAAPPLPPSNFKFGPPVASKTYPAVDPSLYPVVVSASTDTVVRTEKPTDLFSFNLTWNKFQEGYWRNGRVKPEVIEWLKPFQGAYYRYPGGTDSNYFLWEQAIGPVANRQPQQEKYKSWVKVEFGIDEYVDFVKQVGGRPYIVANLSGSHSSKWTPQQAAESNRRWLEYMNKDAKGVSNLTHCAVGSVCPVKLWELGNELDWEEEWSADRYATAVKAVAPVLRNADSVVQLIAMTKTAPWGNRDAAIQYNNVIGNQLRSLVDHYAFHPYYDGQSISNLEKSYVDGAIKDVLKDPGSKIHMTEHALWPYRPAGSTVQQWQQYWPTTGDMGGAISSADFILMAMNRSDIGTAMWHSLGLAGPWQLFYLNSSTDKPYPNVVYWGMRALREALLDEVVKSSVKTPNISKYPGGYDVRAAVTRDKLGSSYSVLAVNRAGSKAPMAVSIPPLANADVTISIRTVSASGPRVGNTATAPNRVQQVVTTKESNFGSNGVIALELPPYSVVSFLINRR